MTPALMLVVALLLAAAGAVATLAIALGQPWAGLNLAASDDGGVVIVSADPYGPNGAIPPGTRLVALAADPEAEGIALTASDIVEEPDTFETFVAMERLFARQGRLHALLSGDSVYADLVTPGETYTGAAINVSPRRAPVDLPPVFWVQLFVGVTTFLVGAWVVSLRRWERSAWLFAVAGVGLFVSALPAAIYSSRELTLDGGLFTVLSNLNFAGAMIFGAGMIGLFLCYPRPIVRGPVLLVPFVASGAWVCADILRLFPGPPLSRHLPTALEMATIAIMVALQFRATRGDPRDRAALRSLGLSVLVGAGGFVLTIIVPPLFGATAVLSQGYAFLFFLLIYVGVAFGVLRYRLFDLDEWAFRILYYMVGILIIVLLDAALVLFMSVERIPAFSVSFVLVAFVYLPFRDVLWRRFFTGQTPSRERLFAQIVDIALTPPGRSQEARWRQVLTDLFDPLNIEPAKPAAVPVIGGDGLSLTALGVGGVPSLKLDYAQRGRRLFGPRDVALVEELRTMLGHAIESRQAYERGVAEERARIARDMHDNIGAQLLSALHSPSAKRKNAMVRESLSDLRDIVNDAARPGLTLQETLADLRSETGERLSAAGIDLDWRMTDATEVSLAPPGMHAMRSVLREAVSNVIRHAGATQVQVEIARQGGWLTARVADDGKGYDPAQVRAGNGISNMRARVEGLKGTLEITPMGKGTALCARFALDPARTD